ncbi:MAG TPA: acyltransferase [Terracidiphilus sp.]|nr:acyltransferase [Terracidiphilus sp.]
MALTVKLSHMTPQPTTGRIPTLDGWRGIAILLVLASHVTMGVLGHPVSIPFGVHGVTIFFVLSGYLITTKLMEEQARTGRISLRRFYLRRFFRLMPAAWLYLLVAVAIVGAASVTVQTHAEAIVASLLFFRNYLDLHGRLQDTGQFWLTAHFWTLSMEEQFYLLWPGVMVLAGLRKARWVALVLASGLALYRFSHEHALLQATFQVRYESQYHADALLLGCAAALLLPQIRVYLRGWMVWPLAVILVWCGLRYSDLIPFGESVVIALLLCVTSLNPKTAISRLLDWRPLAYIGTISYSLYLWQQLFLFFPGSWGVRGTLLRLTLLLVMTIFSYYCIERTCLELYAGARAKTDAVRRSPSTESPAD